MPSPSETGGERCAVCGPPILLDDHRRLRVEHLGRGDRASLQSLYRSLSRSDLHRRFFAGTRPPPRFFDTWTSLEANGGLVIGVYVDQGEDAESQLIGEAGYALLDDGDGELGMAVAPASRGWLGPWLLDVLLRHAAARGVPNIQALVLAENKEMMAMVAHRGFAVLDHLDWGTLRLTMSTEGIVPSWPKPIPDSRPRLLVESDRSRWWGEETLRDEGFDVAICSGGCRRTGRCPVLSGEPCPLVDGADAVVIDLAPDDPRTAALIAAERLVHPGVRLVAGYTRDDDGSVRHRPGSEIAEDLDDL